MGALDQVVKMKSQGKTREEIINSLQDQGVSPKAISDALNQSEIKSAVSSSSMDSEEMEPSMMSSDSNDGVPKPSKYSPKTIEMDSTNQGESYYTPNPQQDYEAQNQVYGAQESLPRQEEYYPQQGYEDYSSFGGSSAMGGMDTDTMIEIAEQVFSEKIRKIQKQIEEMEKFKVLAETKILHNEERLKRIESSIDKLQAAILEKVGSYGRGLESIKKEMTMMQDSFSKILPSVSEHLSKSHHPNHKK